MTTKTEQKNTVLERPPIVVVMGHIDHGKSTLLDYIRKTNIVDKEAGGITQHVAAYEVNYKSTDGKERRITFLDTPGHEAFRTLRSRGAKVADIAILVVSAEDGVKPQTVEALSWILETKIPYVVAINKIDRPGADVDRTKVSLAEHEVYVEGFGGTISAVPISAKTGEGIPELLDIVTLQADLAELKADPNEKAQGLVIESKLNPKKGVSATLIIKNGSLKTGQHVAADTSYTPVRIMEDSDGKKISQATFSTPITIFGWSEPVQAGNPFFTFDSKEEALKYIEVNKLKKSESKKTEQEDTSEIATLPIVVKADTIGSIEAILYEISKLKKERIIPKIILHDVGTINESDVKLAAARKGAVIVGFHTKVDNAANTLAERDGVEIQTFEIIYKLTEWLDSLLKERTPKINVEEVTGSAKVLKVFSKQKDKQIIGGRVENGFLAVGEIFKIIRRESEIGTGKIRGLQQQKKDVSEIKAGEFGSFVESKIEIVPGDVLRMYKIVEK